MKTVKTVVCVLLALVIFAGTLGGLAMLAAKSVVSDPDALARGIADEKYDALVCSFVRGDVEHAMLLLSVDEDLFEKSVSDAEIIEAAHGMLTAATRRILTNDRGPLPGFTSDKLREAIQNDIHGFAAEHGLEVEDGAVDEVYVYLCDRVTSQIMIADESYLDKIPDLSRLQNLLDLWYAPFAAALLCAVMIVILRLREPARALTAVAAPAYFASLIGFVVFRVIQTKDYISNLSLDSSMLREFLVRLYRIASASFVKYFGIALAASLVLLTAALVLTALSRPNKKEKAPGASALTEAEN